MTIEPGYFQTNVRRSRDSLPALDVPQRGRKTGRVAKPVLHPGPTTSGEAGYLSSPRPVREQAWEDTLRRHDLLPIHPSQVGSNKDFNENQGQVFDPQEVQARSTQTDQSRARELGAPTGRIQVEGKTNKKTGKKAPDSEIGYAAQPGFFPDMDKKTKILAINNFAKARIETGDYRGGSHFGEVQENRERVAAAGRAALSVTNGPGNAPVGRAQHPNGSMVEPLGHERHDVTWTEKTHHPEGRSADWYTGVEENGRNDSNLPGQAPLAIQAQAARHGVSQDAMTRTTAITSPQMTWESSTGELPNLHGASAIHGAVKDLKAHTPDPSEATVRRTGQDSGTPLGVLPDMAGKAAAEIHERGNSASNPFPVKDVKSQKAPNFEGALHLSHIDPAVRRIAATAWPVDRHDAAIAGVDRDKHLGWRGVNEAVAKTGRTSALKARMLPGDKQALDWVGHRALKGLYDTPELFSGGRDDAPLVPTEAALPKSMTRAAKTRILKRAPTAENWEKSDTAQKYGLEF